MPLYNLACCEASPGTRRTRSGTCASAIERRPQLQELAREDSDFDAIRDEPGFEELVA